MGEIADGIMEGLLDSETGELIDGDAPGHPRTKRRHRKWLPRNVKPYQCRHCGKRLKTEQGLRDHRRDKHAADAG